MKLQSIKDMSPEFKMLLLRELGYDSDGTFVLEENGSQVLDRYTDEPVRLDNMAIFPMAPGILDGHTFRIPPIILNNDLYSITLFLEEFNDIDFEEGSP